MIPARELYEKLGRVISSCQTNAQFEVARRYADLVARYRLVTIKSEVSREKAEKKDRGKAQD